MGAHHQSSDVRGGMIRTRCSRCGKNRYVQVSPGTRRKIVRCSCGLSGSYTVNYRNSIRESSSMRAQAILGNAREAAIRLCDTSATGVGFLIPKEYALSLYRGQEICIKLRGSSGLAQRKVKIMNIAGNRVGGQYA